MKLMMQYARAVGVREVLSTRRDKGVRQTGRNTQLLNGAGISSVYLGPLFMYLVQLSVAWRHELSHSSHH